MEREEARKKAIELISYDHYLLFSYLLFKFLFTLQEIPTHTTHTVHINTHTHTHIDRYRHINSYTHIHVCYVCSMLY